LPSYLKNLTTPASFSWAFKPACGSARGILVGVRDESLLMSNVDILNYSVSCMLQDPRGSFAWKLVVVYSSPYDEGKIEFIDELHNILSRWRGPTMIGGDFNHSRFSLDKSNGVINQRYADCFNDWVNKWGLIEVSPTNRKFTWANNQNNLILAKLDRIFISTEWESAFPLVRVKGLAKNTSDHSPLLLDLGENCEKGVKKFRFEKWWLEREDFKDIVRKAWEVPC
jgi:hypothetical protein